MVEYDSEVQERFSGPRARQNVSSPIVHTGSTRNSKTLSLSAFWLDPYGRSKVHEWRTAFHFGGYSCKLLTSSQAAITLNLS